MKVRELINVLAPLDPDMEVTVYDSELGQDLEMSLARVEVPHQKYFDPVYCRALVLRLDNK